MRTLQQRLDWLAGIVDGEGCVTAMMAKRGGRDRLRFTVCISNTCEALIQEVAAILDSVGIKYCLVLHVDGRRTRKPWTDIVIQAKDNVERVLLILANRIVAKRAQVEIVLRMIRERRHITVGQSDNYTTVPIGEDQIIHDGLTELRKLNHQGIAP